MLSRCHMTASLPVLHVHPSWEITHVIAIVQTYCLMHVCWLSESQMCCLVVNNVLTKHPPVLYRYGNPSDSRTSFCGPWRRGRQPFCSSLHKRKNLGLCSDTLVPFPKRDERHASYQSVNETEGEPRCSDSSVQDQMSRRCVRDAFKQVRRK